MARSPLNLSDPEQRSVETRSPLDNPAVGLYSDAAFAYALNEWSSSGFSGESVTEETALGIPAVWAAVNVLSAAVALLPLQLFTKSDNGPQKATSNPLYRLLHDVVNTDLETSFEWRKYMMVRLLTKGRAYTFIEKNKAGRPMNLWKLDPDLVTPVRQGFAKRYVYRPPGGGEIIYDSSEIIDLCWMPQSDGLGHFNPLNTHRNSLGLLIAAERWASKLFQNGGMVPLVLTTTTAASPASLSKAGEDLQAAQQRARDIGRNVLPMPPGFDLKAIGINPEEAQLLDLKRFGLTEVARIFNVPPSFLQDLSNGTYSNVEQADIAFVKHSLHPWTEMWEQQLNTKLFGGRPSNTYIEFNVDALQKGDFLSQMTGLRTAVYGALITPNEARALSNREALPGGDQLLIQGATVPLTKAGESPAAPSDAPNDPNPDPSTQDDEADQGTTDDKA